MQKKKANRQMLVKSVTFEQNLQTPSEAHMVLIVHRAVYKVCSTLYYPNSGFPDWWNLIQ